MGDDTDDVHETSDEEEVEADEEDVEISIQPRVRGKKRPLPDKEQGTPTRRQRSNTYGSQGGAAEQQLPNSQNLSENQQIIKMLKAINTQMTSLKNSVRKEISEMRKDVEEVKTEVKTIKEAITSQPQTAEEINNEVSITTMSEQITLIQETIKNLDNKVSTGLAPIKRTTTQVAKIAITSVKDVESQLKKRKLAYYQQHQNNDRVAIHKQWLESDPPTLPAAFIPKYIQKEPAFEYETRKKQKINDLNAWLEILGYRAQKANEEVANIDGLVQQEIMDSNLSQEDKDKETKTWVEMVKEQEKVSEQIWKKKREEILKQPERQKEQKSIQNLEGRTYATVAKTNLEQAPNSSNQAESDGEWQPVSYRRRNTNNNPNRSNSGRPNRGNISDQYTRSNTDSRRGNSNGPSRGNTRGSSRGNTRGSYRGRGQQSNFLRRGPPYREK